MYAEIMDSDSFDSDSMASDSMASDSTASYSVWPRLGPTAPSQCAVCFDKSGLLLCGGCKVVHYCGTEHQAAHRSKHKVSCNTIKNTRERLEHEKSKLQDRTDSAFEAQPSSENVFQTGVGHFWGIVETRDYMRARFAAANALLQVDTKRAVENALEHFNEMIRLCRHDNQGVRDIIPHAQLRLGQEQECYRFLKWWATTEKTWDVETPYLDLPEADPLEPVDIFSSKEISLDHLMALTLLKLRLYLEMDACSTYVAERFYSDMDKPRLGHYVRKKMKEMDDYELEQAAQTLKHQYLTLCNQVHEANPYVWATLVDGEIPSPPQYSSRGSQEEADLVVYQCHQAWNESGDAMVVIDADTAAFTNVYQGQAAAASGRNTSSTSSATEIWGKTQGTGRAFPSKFQSIHSPNDLFVPTVTAGSDIPRFVHRHDPAKVLVFVDGACSNNGQQEPQAGWAVVLGPPTSKEMKNDYCTVSGRLENKGPFGGSSTRTSNRAELRAAIAALRLCDWQAEGYANLVIATDSSYVVDGATEWSKKWVRNGWKNNTGGDVKNRDLWELVLGEVERWVDNGFAVDFWNIPRDLNNEADRAAKRITQTGSAVEEFNDVTLNSGQSRGRILALCLESEDLFDACFGTLVSRITAKSKMERARTPEAALAMLDQEPRPTVVLVTDGGLARQRKIWDRVIDHLRDGATVVLAGCFSNMVTKGEFDRFFARLGLPWKRGSYHRTTLCLNTSGDGISRQLPASCSLKALFVQNVERSATWYSEGTRSAEAAVAFVRVGSGRLGYIGDVNGEDASDQAVLAMCGLL
ncbi:unnamed protein product [Clonostachys rosea f. rosea IK726]|jgi:ribonuclease HI|uniref:Uncharacterized protein n=1 Tax=Clonostachys rosea f. rosea IK726 TaxID=1349383 RepID=A0ACA9TV37_BIOOC|nr:unnamed protein product [Clonostachys rosea f. rosea IK726]